MDYRQRFYRDFTRSQRWESYRVKVESTDLFVKTHGNQALRVQTRVRELRGEIKKHIRRQPEFLGSLLPINQLPNEPGIVTRMKRAALKAGVGPMAAVAGAIAEAVGLELAGRSKEVIVENGGDCFFSLKQPAVSTIFAGESLFSGKIAIRIDSGKTPLAVCTSSGTVGPSYSRGRADAATIISGNGCLADALATGTANIIASEHDLEAGLEYALNVPGILGVVLVYKDKLAVKGDVRLLKP
ncbi:MAG: UPF0280 family protein [Thermodesulfobacteriota bacterium]